MMGFNIFNENPDEYIEDLQLFLKENYDNRIQILNHKNYKRIQRPLLVFFHNFQLKSTKFWTDMLNEVAIKYLNDIQFAVADLEDVKLFHADPNEMDFFGFDGNSEPYIFAIDADERQHKYTEPLELEKLISYCDMLANNKVYRSDPIPTRQDPTRAVEVIVADNFKELVEQNEKNVFVTLHSRLSFKNPYFLWSLPNHVDPNGEDFVFYKINSQTNYVPLEYAADQYPTSYLIPRNDRRKKLKYVHTSSDAKLYGFITNAIKEKKPKEPESIQNSLTQDQTKILSILEKLTGIIEKKLPNEPKDDRGFSKYLNTVLNKIEEPERDNIKAEIITLASNRVNEILRAKANSINEEF